MSPSSTRRLPEQSRTWDSTPSAPEQKYHHAIHHAVWWPLLPTPCSVRSLSQTDGARLLGTLNAGPIAGPPVPFSRSQEPVWGAAGAYSACVCVNARTAGFSALAYPQGTSSKLGSDRGEPGWVSRSCWTNQQISHQPYEIGRDASAFKLSHDRGTETPSTERVKPIEVIKGPFSSSSRPINSNSGCRTRQTTGAGRPVASTALWAIPHTTLNQEKAES